MLLIQRITKSLPYWESTIKRIDSHKKKQKCIANVIKSQDFVEKQNYLSVMHQSRKPRLVAKNDFASSISR